MKYQYLCEYFQTALQSHKLYTARSFAAADLIHTVVTICFMRRLYIFLLTYSHRIQMIIVTVQKDNFLPLLKHAQSEVTTQGGSRGDGAIPPKTIKCHYGISMKNITRR